LKLSKDSAYPHPQGTWINETKWRWSVRYTWRFSVILAGLIKPKKDRIMYSFSDLAKSLNVSTVNLSRLQKRFALKVMAENGNP